MYSEHLAIMLILAASQTNGPQPPSGPIAEDARHAVMRAVKEPELVAALSQRIRRNEVRKWPAANVQTLLASAR